MKKLLYLFFVLVCGAINAQQISNPQQIGQTSRNQSVGRGFWVLADTALFTSKIWIPFGGGNGKVLTSDADGFGTWQTPSIATGTPNQILYFDSAGNVTSDNGFLRNPNSFIVLNPGSIDSSLFYSDTSNWNISAHSIAIVTPNTVDGNVFIGNSSTMTYFDVDVKNQSLDAVPGKKFSVYNTAHVPKFVVYPDSATIILTSLLSFPNITGAGNGKVLTSDASGNATWSSVSGIGWLTTGNSGLDSTNFIGTIDSVSMHIKVFDKPSGTIEIADDPPTFGGNTVYGYESYNNVLHYNNIGNSLFGTFAGSSMALNSQFNNAIGLSALSWLVTGIGNVANGYHTFQEIENTNYNVGVGYMVCGNNVKYLSKMGDNNIGIGNQTLYSGTYGNDNITLGTQAFANNLGSTFNIAIGYQAIASSIGFINSNALISGKNYVIEDVGSTDWTLVGADSSQVGVYFTATGTTSGGGHAIPVGNYNIGIGYQALGSNTYGERNIAIGNNALIINTAGSYNTAFGDGAGSHNITGQNNSFYGFGANVISDGISNATAIGSGSLIGVSNGISLGDSTTVKVGIGTAYPTERLDVRGSIRMVDGNQASQKVMVSDDYGNATWKSAPIILADTFLTSLTNDATLISLTTGSADANYEISGSLNVTARVTDIIQYEVDYTDETNTSTSFTLISGVNNTGHALVPTINIRAKSSTSITVRCILTNSSGSISYNAGGTIKQLGTK